MGVKTGDPEARTLEVAMTTDAEVERTRDEYRALSSGELERRLDLKEIGEPGSWQITVALAVLEEKNRHGRLQLQQEDTERALGARGRGAGIVPVLLGGACFMAIVMLILVFLRAA